MKCASCGRAVVSSNPVLVLCTQCYDPFIAWLRHRTESLPARVIKWMIKLESAYLARRVLYTEDVERDGAPEGVKRPTSIEINGGLAPGFSAKSKEFFSLEGLASSFAVKLFMQGFTICECEGAMQAVLFNAVCDVLGDELFDIVFPRVHIKISGCPLMQFFKKQSYFDGMALHPGDWLYVFNTEIEEFRDHVQRTGSGGAASGWNLIYISGNRFLGFGLSTESPLPLTLDEVRTKMIASVTRGAPKAASETRSGLEFGQRSGHRRQGSADLGRKSSPSSLGLGQPRRGLRPENIVLKFKWGFDVEAFIGYVVKRLPPAMLLNPSPTGHAGLLLSKEVLPAYIEGLIVKQPVFNDKSLDALRSQVPARPFIDELD